MRLAAAFALAVGLVSSAAAAAAAAPAARAQPIEFPRDKERWITLSADEFAIYGNASPGKVAALATELLRMRDAVGKLTQLTVKAPQRTRVFVFATERTFAPFRDAALQARSDNVDGAFISAPSGNVIILRGDSSSGVTRVVFHELTHYFVRNTLPGLPLWFNEGLAEYYSTFGVGEEDALIGRPIPEHVLWLRERRLIPLRDLFAMDAMFPGYDEGSRQGVFYAQSWALVHYLMQSDPQGPVKLATFLALLRGGRSQDAAFSEAFGTTYDALERDLRAYVGRPSFAFMHYPLAALPARDLGAPVEMTRDAVLFELGHLLTWTSRANAAEGERFLKEAIAINPKLAAAHADLGRIYGATGRAAEAEQAYERAVQLGTGDADVHLAFGHAVLERIMRAGPGAASPADVTKARALFSRAAELDAAAPRAWAGLGATYLPSPDDPAPGIAALEKSLTLAPGAEDAAFNLVQLYARAGRRDDAERLVASTLAQSGDPEIVAKSREAMVRADVPRVNELIAAGKPDEAMALARSISSRTSDAALKARLADFAAGLEASAATNREIASLNEAIDRANAGDHAAALSLVDVLLQQAKDPEVLTRAQQVRERLMGAMERRGQPRADVEAAPSR